MDELNSIPIVNTFTPRYLHFKIPCPEEVLINNNNKIVSSFYIKL
jgi:hypothetical protein